MYTKADLFNIALGALLLERQIVDADEDKSVEAKSLRRMFPIALAQALQDMDLDKTIEIKNAEMVVRDPSVIWRFAYKYPDNCAMIRRLVSGARMDNRETKIPLQTGLFVGQPVIYTNDDAAAIEYIPNDLNLGSLSASAGLAVAWKLAHLCAALQAGKGAQKIRQEILTTYILFKEQAQAHDRLENMNFEVDNVVSEFVNVRTS